MGTNYYLEKPKCPTCGHSGGRLHIGKSSAGWCFSLHVIPELGLTSLAAWVTEWRKPDAEIRDEYGEPVPIMSMLEIVTLRGSEADTAKWEEPPYGYPNWAAFHASNHSEQGPVGLLRHRIGRHCVGHGPGTWDLIPGEFS